MTTRQGGVSTGQYSALNLGTHVQDDPQHVAKNRQRVQDHVGRPLAFLTQVHGTWVEDRTSPAGAPEADAQVTERSDFALHIGVADCLPVGFAQIDGQKVGAAHAGWRGLLGGVIENTAAHFQRDCVLVLGPCIGPTAFQVGGEVREQFLDTDAALSRFFQPDPEGRFLCDLKGIARHRIARLGIPVVDDIDDCTFTQAERWFSYRRERPGGRMGLVIWRTD